MTHSMHPTLYIYRNAEHLFCFNTFVQKDEVCFDVMCVFGIYGLTEKMERTKLNGEKTT